MAGTTQVAGSLWGAMATLVAVLLAVHGSTAGPGDRGTAAAAPEHPVSTHLTARLRPSAADANSRRPATSARGPAPPIVSTWGTNADRWRRVHCVDGVSGAPQAGVEVHVLPRTRTAWKRLEAAIQQSADPRDVVRHLGAQVVSDRSGAVRLQLPEVAEVLLLAASEHGFASITALTGAPGPWELELWPVRRFAVQLLDVRGGPVPGVELVLGYRSPTAMQIGSGRTDERGFAHFGIGPRPADQFGLELALAGPTASSERLLAVLDLKNLPSLDTPLVVRLPLGEIAARPRGKVSLGLREAYTMLCIDPPCDETLLRGRVVDDGGQPLAGVSVRWAEWSCNAIDVGGCVAWDDTRTFTAVDGTFELPIAETARWGSLQLHRADLVPRYPGTPPGGDLGNVAMQRRCDVFGVVRLPTDLGPREVELVARIGMCHMSVPLAPDGGFVLSLYPFRPGLDRSLTLSLQGERWVGEPLPILSIDALAPGPTELGTIDLRPLVARTRLDVVGTRGPPMGSIHVVLPGSSLPISDRAGPSTRSQFETMEEYVHRPGGERRLELRDPSGRYLFHHGRGGAHIAVQVEAGRSLAVHLAGGTQRLMLRY